MDHDFKKFVRRLYGSQKKMAQALSVTENTVSNWVLRNPYPMLKHAPQLVRDCNTTNVEIMSEVLAHAETVKHTASED